MGLIAEIGQELGNAIQEAVYIEYRNIKGRLEELESHHTEIANVLSRKYNEVIERFGRLETGHEETGKYQQALVEGLQSRVVELEKCSESLEVKAEDHWGEIKLTIRAFDALSERLSKLETVSAGPQVDVHHLTSRVETLEKSDSDTLFSLEHVNASIQKLETLYNSSKLADIREAHGRLDLVFKHIRSLQKQYAEVIEKLVSTAVNRKEEPTSWEEAAEELNLAKSGIAAGREQCAAQLEQWLNNATGRHYLGFAQSSLADELRNLIHQWRSK